MNYHLSYDQRQLYHFVCQNVYRNGRNCDNDINGKEERNEGIIVINVMN
jgi:hypothetical protein